MTEDTVHGRGYGTASWPMPPSRLEQAEAQLELARHDEDVALDAAIAAGLTGEPRAELLGACERRIAAEVAVLRARRCAMSRTLGQIKSLPEAATSGFETRFQTTLHDLRALPEVQS